MARSIRPVRFLVAVAVVTAGMVASPLVQSANAAPFNYDHLAKIQKRLVSGLLAHELAPPSEGGIQPNAQGGDHDNDGADPDGLPDTPPAGFAVVNGTSVPGNYNPLFGGTCAQPLGLSVKVNTNCLNVTDPDLQGRGQANNETAIAINPSNQANLVAGDNDYVRGDGTCGSSYSLDGGHSWHDSTVPDGFTRGSDFQAPSPTDAHARQYWQSGGDTSVAFDSRGNAYLSCQLFNRGTVASANPDQSSEFVVFRSTGNGGASWNFPGRPTTAWFDPSGTGAVLEDKALMAVDSHVTSPFRDRIYVTWTEFAADGSGYIWETHSSDYGQTFSPRVLVSQDSAMCPVTYGLGTPVGRCNENQFSDPVVGPDGALYVAYANFNNAVTGNDNRNQMLLVKSTDGGQTFGAPVKASDYYDLPDCFTYQGDDPGRACVPEKGASNKSVFRATNYPTVVVNPRNAHQVVVAFGSYINRNSKESNGCVPAGFSTFGTNLYTGVKTPGACNNDVLVSVSNDAGASFSGSDPRTGTSVSNGGAQRTTDQWWQWAAFTSAGKLAVSYYDRQYGSDETTGYSDVSLSGGNAALNNFLALRVTSSSMPPPTQFYGVTGGQFWGDYTGLDAQSDVYPIWSDTRNADVFVCPGTATGPGNPPALCTAAEPNGVTANDQEIYTQRMPLISPP